MKDFSQLLVNKTDAIVAVWVEAVYQDRQIESANNLSHSAIENHIPHVLKAMATVLSQSQDSEIQPIVKASLTHGIIRAEQGFDPSEVAREYCLLRQAIFSNLEPDLRIATVAEVIRTFCLIDAVIDEAIAKCFTSYMEERLRELQQLQNQLQFTNQELTRLVRANQDTLSHLAHEFKTPLTSIIGYSDLFLRQQKQQEAQVRKSFAHLEHIERVLRSGRQLLRMVNDALEISRYEAGKMKLRLMSTQVLSIVNNVIEVMEPLAAAKQLKLEIDCDRAPDRITTDPLRLQQIVTNLLSNAIRYTEVGSVKLTCYCLVNDEWAIAVTDTGIGIASEDQSRIFDPYFQVMPSGARSTESTGLGLAIVSRLVKLLQGKIELVSQLGVGSTFTIILPLEVKSDI